MARHFFGVVLIAALMSVPSVTAQTLWTNASTSTDWFNPTNWSPNIVPTNGTEDAQFSTTPSGVTNSVGINFTAAGGLVQVGAIELTASRNNLNLLVGNN
ncbi:MAG TPA: hypothetical protein VK742_07755, partial [Candidatus Sulfotelmatobacter sp.]|nr:hypothetical protein [Candidatus Sulfotelmatobacter sp.]